MTRKALRALASVRLTVGILVALGALFLVGLLVPQQSVLRTLYRDWRAEQPVLVAALEWIGLTDVYASPLALALWAAFFVNLTASMLSRAPGILRRAFDAAPAPSRQDLELPFRRAWPSAAPDAGARARAYFAARRYAIAGTDACFRAVRNRSSPVATLLFHFSFVVILGGGVSTVLTRSEGTVSLGEGETFTGAPAQYTAPPRVARFGRLPSTRFIVEKVLPEMVGGVSVRVRVMLRDEHYLAQAIEINQPYEADDGTSFVFKNLGIAPLLVVTGPDGRELGGGYVRLDVLNGKADRLELLGRSMRAELIPDWTHESGAEREGSAVPTNPALRLSFETDTGRTVRQTIRLGDTARLGPYAVRFDRWRYWVKLYVRRERGIGVLFAGFALAAAALVWRLLLFRRDFVVAVEGGEAVLAGRADYYRALFADEFGRVAAELEAELAPETAREGAA